jgi:hypothetical protein
MRSKLLHVSQLRRVATFVVMRSHTTCAVDCGKKGQQQVTVAAHTAILWPEARAGALGSCAAQRYPRLAALALVSGKWRHANRFTVSRSVQETDTSQCLTHRSETIQRLLFKTNSFGV